MNHTTKTLASMALGCFVASSGVQAASIQSLTFQEISMMSGGIGTSANDVAVVGEIAYGAGWFNGTTPQGVSVLGYDQHFYSAGSTDGAMIMGTQQGNNAFAVATLPGYNFNTLSSAPSGTINNGALSLDLSGLTIEAQGQSVNVAANNSSLNTSVSKISASRYFYTADWTHTSNNDVTFLSTGNVNTFANGYTWQMHMEGIAKVDVAYTPGIRTIVGMSIEEIGGRSGGFSNSALNVGGGNAYIGIQAGTPHSFVSAGSNDGQILMGSVQGAGDFTPGGLLLNSLALPNTRYGAPTGTVTDGTILDIDLSGWGLDWGSDQFTLPPDAGSLSMAVEEIDGTHYFYTLDWTHVITSEENSQYSNMNTFWHLEGILVTAVPEANTYAMMLAGLGLVGFMANRRRKQL